MALTQIQNAMTQLLGNNSGALSIDSSGNMGIGNTSQTQAKLLSYPSANQVGLMVYGNGTAGYPAFGFSGQVTSNGGRGAGMYLPDDGVLAWSTGGSERMRINSSGNVGIGQNNPSLRLDVYGSIKMSGGSGTALTWDTSISSQYIKYDLSLDGLIMNGYAGLAFYTNGAERIRIDSAGNVGIGTNTPSSYVTSGLSVYSSQNSTQTKFAIINPNSSGSAGAVQTFISDSNQRLEFTLTSTGWGDYGTVKRQSGTISAYGTSSTYLTLAGQAGIIFGYGANPHSEAARFDSSGNLLIGVNSVPDSASKFTVSGTSIVLLDASGSLLRFNKSSGTDTGWLSNRSYSWHDGNGLALSTQTSSPLRFGTNATERMFIDTTQVKTILPLNVDGGMYAASYGALGGTYTANTWYLVTHSGLLTKSGIYIIEYYAETYNAGGALYAWYACTVPFAWNPTNTNSGNSFTFPALMGSGHADNGQSQSFSFRLRQTAGATDGKSYIEFATNVTLSGLNGTSGKSVTISVKRLA